MCRAFQWCSEAERLSKCLFAQTELATVEGLGANMDVDGALEIPWFDRNCRSKPLAEDTRSKKGTQVVSSRYLQILQIGQANDF
jgi:hypothetical protein